MAPLVTAAAANGIPLAQSVCNHGACAVATAIRLVGSSFHTNYIPVSFIGSVIRSDFITKAIIQTLSVDGLQGKNYSIKEPACSPVIGAVLLAYEKIGVNVNEAILNRLSKHPKAKFEN